MKFKVAVIQLEIAQWQPEVNVRRMEEFVEKAVGQGAQVIIFPEDCVTGPILKNEKFVDKKGEYLKIFVNMAKKYQVDFIPGSWMEEDAALKGWYNTCYYIGADGKVLKRYRKINLWLPERKYLTPGNEIAVFQTRFGKVGLIICWDLMYPEIFRKMLARGVQVIYCPSNWSKGLGGIGLKHHAEAEVNHVNALCQARAIENNIVLVYCNVAGKANYGGHKDEMIGISQIAVPFKGFLQKIEGSEEAMFVEEVDLEILKDAELAYKLRRDFKNQI